MSIVVFLRHVFSGEVSPNARPLVARLLRDESGQDIIELRAARLQESGWQASPSGLLIVANRHGVWRCSTPIPRTAFWGAPPAPGGRTVTPFDPIGALASVSSGMRD